MSKKILVDKAEFLPVPPGTKIKYEHFYNTVDGQALFKEDGTWLVTGSVAGDGYPIDYDGPRILAGTTAWLEDGEGREVFRAYSTCNPKDTPNKKLGRLIAHNRCIKAFLKSQANWQPVD